MNKIYKPAGYNQTITMIIQTNTTPTTTMRIDLGRLTTRIYNILNDVFISNRKRFLFTHRRMEYPDR